MALVTTKNKKTDIPHEDGQWMDLRPLSGIELNAAETVASRTRLEALQAYPEKMIEMMRDEIGKMRTAKASADEALGDKYDIATVLENGILGWSYEGSVNVGLLDDKTLGWAFETVMAMSVRSKEAGESSASA